MTLLGTLLGGRVLRHVFVTPLVTLLGGCMLLIDSVCLRDTASAPTRGLGIAY
jgi:hypothetical protein